MNVKIRKKILNKVSILVFIVILFSFPISAVMIDTDARFFVENETYTVSHPMNFHTITVADTYIVFNTTGFYVTSGNAITISLSYINSNIAGAGNGVKVLEFYGTTTSGSVVFGLSGFPAGTKYDVKRGGVPITTVTANDLGFISFSNTAWSTQLFGVYQNGSVPNSPPPPNPPPPSGPPEGGNEENHPPLSSFESSGPMFVEMGIAYSYSVSTIDPDGDNISYMVDWGDGMISDWSEFVASGASVSLMHSWMNVNIYLVRAVAQDEHGLNSSWSSVFNVTVSGVSVSGEPPVATINVSADLMTNQSVEFDASGSFDPDGIVVSYLWDFGDGTTESGMNPVHVYSQPGQYMISLLVIDNKNNTFTTSVNVTVTDTAVVNTQQNQRRETVPVLSFTSIIFLVVFILVICVTLFFRKSIKSFVSLYIVNLVMQFQITYTRYKSKRICARKAKLRVVRNIRHTTVEKGTVLEQDRMKSAAMFYHKMHNDSPRNGESVVSEDATTSDRMTLSSGFNEVQTKESLGILTKMERKKMYVEKGTRLSSKDIEVMVDTVLRSTYCQKKPLRREYVTFVDDDSIERSVDNLIVQKMREFIDHM